MLKICMEFLNGGLAGAGATIFTNPIDLVKTRMQLQGEGHARQEAVRPYQNTLQAMYVIGRKEGPLALQKGLVAALHYGLVMNGLRLGAYSIADGNHWTRTAEGKVCLYKATFWSYWTGGVAAWIANPCIVVKSRMQSIAHESLMVGKKQHQYKGAMAAYRKIYYEEGLIKGLYGGAFASAIRISLGGAAQLVSYTKAKEALYQHGICRDSTVGISFLASLVSGVVIVITCCPLDVATVRLYNQGDEKLYNGTTDALRKIFYAEGLHGLYKGMMPLYYRVAPHTTLTLVIWDVFNDILLDKKTGL